MVGLGIGLISGCLQFWLLSQFTKGIASGTFSIKTVLLGMVQFFLPMGILILMAFIRRQDLLWTGIGITGAVILGAIIKYIIGAREAKGGGDKE